MVFRIMPSQFGLPEGVDCPDVEFAAHADFVETSVMLALDESIVHLDGRKSEARGRAAVRTRAGRKVADRYLHRMACHAGPVRKRRHR